MEITGHFIDEKFSLKSTAFAIVQWYFVCVFNKTDLVSSHVILDIQSNS